MADVALLELFKDSSARKWGGMTRPQRFRSKCTQAPNGCVIHTGHCDKDGYPMVTVKNSAFQAGYRASHVALALEGKVVPKGSQVNHRCDNRRCVNTDHLVIGSQKDNVHDMMEKDRHAVGERHTISKLTDDAVRDIRANCVRRGQPKLFAAKYGVKISTIWAVRTKQNWKHVNA